MTDDVKQAHERLMQRLEAVGAKLAPMFQAREQGGRWRYCKQRGWHLVDAAGTVLWTPEGP